MLATKNVKIAQGEGQAVTVDFGVEIDQARYAVICFNKNEKVKLHCSQQRLTGVLSLENNNTAYGANFGQKPDQDIGVESFDFWCPQRRPGGHNLALVIDPPWCAFGPDNLTNGFPGLPTGPTPGWPPWPIAARP